MPSVVVLYTEPEQVDEFERRYLEDYVPRLRAHPGLRGLTLQRVVGGPIGEPPYYRMEIWRLQPGATAESVFASPLWHEARAALRFARGLATPMFVEEEVLDG